MPEWLVVALRTLLAVVVLFGLTKLLGKRQISRLSLFEYITGITIGSIAANVSVLESSWYLALVAMSVWALVSLGSEYLQIKGKRVRDFIDSKSTVLIKDGKIMDDNLKKERLNTDELLEQLRKKNIFRAADVEFAMIEPSGEINVLLKKDHQPLTAAHLGIKVGPEQEPQAVIMDGKIMDEPLATIGLSRQWLTTELEKIGAAVENVFLAQVDSYGQLFVDLYDDQILVPAPQKKTALLALIKKCEADLEMFALSTTHKQSKKVYEQCSQQLEQVIRDLKPLLIR